MSPVFCFNEGEAVDRPTIDLGILSLKCHRHRNHLKTLSQQHWPECSASRFSNSHHPERFDNAKSRDTRILGCSGAGVQGYGNPLKHGNTGKQDQEARGLRFTSNFCRAYILSLSCVPCVITLINFAKFAQLNSGPGNVRIRQDTPGYGRICLDLPVNTHWPLNGDWAALNYFGDFPHFQGQAA